MQSTTHFQQETSLVKLMMQQLLNTWIDIVTTGLEKMLLSVVRDLKNQVLNLTLKDGDQMSSHLPEH